ncbi:MAG TPA: type I-U CRISPR-associated protein Cas8c [Thermoguttaceae bacterium]|nr:type I-U CRISPR-associated protein Cas8c [Thermoguttaceae bacterium]
MTDHAKPSITANVDVTNPGQFFAGCGLLELANRLWPGAEGWFNADGSEFHIACNGTLDELINAFKKVEISSSLTPDQQKRLATLLSVAKTSLTTKDLDEKKQLQAAWRIERLCVSPPFNLWLDWWRDDQGNRTELKTWAAKQMVSEMACRMMVAIQRNLADNPQGDGKLFHPVQDDSLPFNFDSDLCRTGNARDAGFSADTLNLKSEYRPLLELLAFIGLQRFRPRTAEKQEHFTYCVWSVRLPVSVAGAAASGNLQLTNSTQYCFKLFRRTKYMKAFLPAQPYQRSVDNV